MKYRKLKEEFHKEMKLNINSLIDKVIETERNKIKKRDDDLTLTILTNEDDDYLLFVNGKAYNDINYHWAECIMWLENIISPKIKIEMKKFDGKRADYPVYLD